MCDTSSPAAHFSEGEASELTTIVLCGTPSATMVNGGSAVQILASAARMVTVIALGFVGILHLMR